MSQLQVAVMHRAIVKLQNAQNKVGKNNKIYKEADQAISALYVKIILLTEVMKKKRKIVKIYVYMRVIMCYNYSTI